MKVRCDRIDLVERLGAIHGIVSVNTPKPILGDYLLYTESGALVAEATDLEITGRTYMHKVEILEEGQLALPSGRLLSILKELPEDYVEIESIDEPLGANLQSGGFRFKVLGHDADEFPRARESEGLHGIVLYREKFQESLRRVAVATSRDPTRYQLNGVFLELAGGKLTMTATDGKRLAHDQLKVEKDGSLELSAILPNQAVDVMLKVLSSQMAQDERITLQVSETHVALKTEDVWISSTQIEGMYPNYQTAFPKEARTRARGHRSDLLTAARSASLTTDKQTSTVLFRITPEGLILESKAQSIGESRIQIPLELEGDAVEIRFNPVYFIEALRTFEEDEICMELTNAETPVVLRGSQSYVHLVMPLVTK